MRLAICDDNIKDLKDLESIIIHYFNTNSIDYKIDIYSDIEELLNTNLNQYSLLILDVVLNNNINGIDVASKLISIYKDLKIIFSSSHIEYTIDAFDVNAFNYILKPYNKKSIFNKLDKFVDQFKINKIEIIDNKNIKYTININEINYIESYNKKTIIHLTNKSQIYTNKSLMEWNQFLLNYLFAISYKGILVNIKNIKSISDNYLILIGDTKVYLSRRNKKHLQTIWINYINSLV